MVIEDHLFSIFLKGSESPGIYQKYMCLQAQQFWENVPPNFESSLIEGTRQFRRHTLWRNWEFAYNPE